MRRFSLSNVLSLRGDKLLAKRPLLKAKRPLLLGDRFGESLEGSQAPPSFWEVPGLPRKFPELPRKFFGDFPGSSLTVHSGAKQQSRGSPEISQTSPEVSQTSPEVPGLPRRSALSLGSLTPSPDSQRLSLRA